MTTVLSLEAFWSVFPQATFLSAALMWALMLPTTFANNRAGGVGACMRTSGRLDSDGPQVDCDVKIKGLFFNFVQLQHKANRDSCETRGLWISDD